MLNRIRRAVTLTRARSVPKGRHRRPLTPSRPPAAPAFTASADASTMILGRAFDTVNHRHPLRGEENALVRPYVLAWEKRVRPRAVAVASHLPAEAWSPLAGVR
ncbi:hypothetical protein J2Z21_003392 [Streptomyces griseochromogenes]|uniref:Uncharacterized protein n=1 Tax=Streptomyces griseochromogenes TaxID=68214 RepID=A0ABS4LSR9_9ACTN|nr:hypothetical protein [Streptomyces griseochromogenes]